MTSLKTNKEEAASGARPQGAPAAASLILLNKDNSGTYFFHADVLVNFTEVVKFAPLLLSCPPYAGMRACINWGGEKLHLVVIKVVNQQMVVEWQDGNLSRHDWRIC